MKLNRKTVISWLLVLIWMGVIFWLSSMDSDLSNNRSKTTINKVIESTVKETITTNAINIENPDDKIASIVEELNKPLRKYAHATVYFVLALLLINALTVSNISIKKTLVITLIVCFLYACADEYHQTFVKGRTGQFSDVLIDTTGALIEEGIYSLYYLGYKRKRKD